MRINKNDINTPNKPAVTKEWLAAKIKENPARTIGRALLAIYKNQTMSEQSASSTIVQNGIGFCKPDARVGTIGARMYQAHARLDQWCIDVWMRPARDGYPRICKYADQLNAISEEKKKEVGNGWVYEQVCLA
jgi:hypothetical protein